MKAIAKERRQVELFSLIQTSKKSLSIADLCIKFDVEVATIQRDLKELREHGIPIHSIRKGIQLLGKLDLKTYQQLLSLYLASVGNVISYPKNISLMVRKLHGKSIDCLCRLLKRLRVDTMRG